jgi:diguanylate cyclase (GGDEF)-like protein
VHPYQRVLLIMLVIVAGAGVVMSVVSSRSAAPTADLRRLTTRLEPITQQLAATSEHLRTSTTNYFDAIALTDPSVRTPTLQLSSREDDQAQRAWANYRRIALGLPREAQIQAAYEKAATSSRNLAIAVLATDPRVAPFQYAANMTALRASGEEQQRYLSQLTTTMYEPRVQAAEARVVASVRRLHDDTLLVIGIVLAVALLIVLALLRGAVRDERTTRERDATRERQIRRSDLEFRVQRGLEMTRTEEDSYSVIGSALEHVVPDHPTEILVADSSRAHFRQVLTTGPTGLGCSVSAPMDCPVGQSGQVRVFPSSTAIEACPYLRLLSDTPCSAACVPVAVAGRPIGVIHVTAAQDEPPSDETVTSLMLVAQRAGAHIGLLRATARTETQARTDSLTGLYNRRSIEAAAHHLVREGTPFVVAFADLDHFKLLNDKHGHETGDRVLRLFARILRDSVRPTDIPARYGGEEFVVVLPDCSVTDAVTVAERLRGRLRDAVDSGSVPPFTVSVGIARSGPDNGLTETVGRADEALLAAKAAGRDRVSIFPGDDPERSGEPVDHPYTRTDPADTGPAGDDAVDEPAAPPALRLGA